MGIAAAGCREPATIDSIGPIEVYEGEQGVVITVHGTGLADSGTLTVGRSSQGGLRGAQLPLTTELIVSSDGTLAAAVIDLPVMEDLAANGLDALVVEYLQDDLSRLQFIPLLGLDEYVAEAGGAFNLDLINQDLAPLYSSIDLGDVDLRANGIPGAGPWSQPLRFHATHSITGSALLEVRAGGCFGVKAGHPNLCPSVGSGLAGALASPYGEGGSGAGHLDVGSDSSTTPGGASYGNRWLVPLAAEFGASGGPGGATNDLFWGGAGGAGGGVIELVAPRISGRLSLSVGGGGGGVPDLPPITSPCSSPDGYLGGGGGGGSGGAILIRASRSFEWSGLLAAAGGDGGGWFVESESCHDGGQGSDGRIRIDAPNLALDLTSDVAITRGPMWVGVPELVDDLTVSIDITADPGYAYPITVNGEAAATVAATSLTTSVSIHLRQGRNQVCIYVPGSADALEQESRHCEEVVAVP